MAGNRNEPPDEVVGFIDLGTNAVRLLVARLHPDASYSVLSLQREQVRLGEGEFKTRRLTAAAIERAVTVVTQFAGLARSLGAERIVAAATSATREATNRALLVDRLEREAGVSLRVVSGREEARLIFEAVRHRVGLDERPVVVLDIGGGSTEVAVGDAERDLFLDSLKLGALRLASDRFGLEREEPISGGEYRDLKRRIEVTSVYAARAVRALAPVAAYGTSGTIRNLAAVAARAVRDDDGDELPLTLPDLRKAAKLLRGLPLSQRQSVPGLSPERADLIVAGAAVLESLMEGCGLTEVRALGQCGLREGLLFEDLEGREPGRPVHRRLTRERSVAKLARTSGADQRHANRVATLAVQLFDSAGRAGLHRFDETERELLAYAARLHDIGTAVSYNDHHVHSEYLIRNSDLLGFDQGEIDMMATVALMHRKALSPGSYAGHAQLDRRAARKARRLAVLLRIAELLDRGHSGAVTEARLERAGSDAVRLVIVPGGDSRLEQWGLETRRRALEKGLGRRLEIVVLDGREAS